MSLSKLLRWGNRKPESVEAPDTEFLEAEEVRPGTPANERRKNIRWPHGGGANMSWIAEDGAWKTTSILLKNSGQGGMAVLSRKRIDVGRQIWVLTKEGQDWQGIIRYCEPSDNWFQIGFERIQSKAQKSDSKGGTVVRWLEKSGKLIESPVSIRNAGDGRLELVSSKPVPAPTIVLIAGKEVRCLASTQACHKRGNRFLVELEVVTDTYKHPVAV